MYFLWERNSQVRLLVEKFQSDIVVHEIAIVWLVPEYPSGSNCPDPTVLASVHYPNPGSVRRIHLVMCIPHAGPAELLLGAQVMPANKIRVTALQELEILVLARRIGIVHVVGSFISS